MEYVEKIMTLIANSGEARSKAMEAIQVAKTNDFIAAKKCCRKLRMFCEWLIKFKRV